MARDDAAEKRRFTIAISEMAFNALTSGNRGADTSMRMENALLCYLGDSDREKPAWSYPGFLRGSETPSEVELELEVAASLWRRFEQEAVRQEVTVEQLAEHATFYFAAEVDAGRVTQRILDDLGSGEGSESG